MIKEAQERKTTFYFINENETCFGTISLGMIDVPSIVESGQLGVKAEKNFFNPKRNTLTN